MVEKRATPMQQPSEAVAVHTTDSPSPERSEREFASEGASLRRYELDGCTVVEAAGEIDLASSPLLRSVLDEVSSLRVVIDMSRVTFLDSTGVAALVGAWRHAPSVGGCVRLVGAQGAVLKVLQITRVEQVLPIHDDVAAARTLYAEQGCGHEAPAAG